MFHLRHRLLLLLLSHWPMPMWQEPNLRHYLNRHRRRRAKPLGKGRRYRQRQQNHPPRLPLPRYREQPP